MIADDNDVNRPLDHFGPTWIFEEIFTIARAHTKLTQQKKLQVTQNNKEANKCKKKMK